MKSFNFKFFGGAVLVPIPEFELGLTKMKLDERVENCDEMVTCTEVFMTT